MVTLLNSTVSVLPKRSVVPYKYDLGYALESGNHQMLPFGTIWNNLRPTTNCETLPMPII